MPLTEFDLIAKYFTHLGKHREDVKLGVGDDAALLQVPEDQQLVIAMDTMVEGIHFPKQADPSDLGYKILAVNLSDLAAMAARPAWVMLALTMPQLDETWVKAFSVGFDHLLQQYALELVGGDLTKGPLVMSATVLGSVPKNKALTRAHAQIHDKIYVSGTLGLAALAVKQLQGGIELNAQQQKQVFEKYYRPKPRIAEAIALRTYVNACIDISDGLCADLNHILEQSGIGATLNIHAVPIADVVTQKLSIKEAQQLALTGGDDYELCLTVAPEKERDFLCAADSLMTTFQCIGEVEAVAGLRILDENGRVKELAELGYAHF